MAKKRDRKPTLKQYMRRQIDQIRRAFRVPMKITVICRHPTDPSARCVFSDDDMGTLIQVLTDSRAEVEASRVAAAANEDTAS